MANCPKDGCNGTMEYREDMDSFTAGVDVYECDICAFIKRY